MSGHEVDTRSDPAPAGSVAEFEEIVRAITQGEVDAFVVSAGDSDEILTLGNADRPYRLLLEHMPQGGLTSDTWGTVLYSNLQFAQMLQRPVSEIVGQSLYSFVSPDEITALAQHLRNIKTQRDDFETRFTRHDGASFSALISAVFDPQSQSTFLAVTDLTERQQYETLASEEALGRSILDQAIDCIVVCDCDGKIVRASQSARALCDCQPIGELFASAFRIESSSVAIDFANFSKEDLLRDVECSLARADGPAVTIQLSAGPVVDALHRVLGVVITMSDISARKRAEVALLEAQNQKDMFLAVLGHELRSPLQAISTALAVIQRSTANIGVELPSGAVIQRQVEHMVRLVNELNDLTRVSAGKLELNKAHVSLSKVIDFAIELSQPRLAANGQTLEVSLPTEAVSLFVDEARISQVLANLLGNAAKFSIGAGKIQISAQLRGADVRVRVRDYGIGIPRHRLDSIFKMFVQDAPEQFRKEGLGLGLMIARQIVDLHGGTIEALSDGPGTGSEFIVTLPRGPDSAEVLRSSAQDS